VADQSAEDPVGKDIAASAPEILAVKARQPWQRILVLACLAGAFIAFGSIMSLVMQAYMGDVGIVRVLSGLGFSVGLVLVMIVGAELFTGNTMMVLPAVKGELAPGRMVGAWSIVWVGNLIGSLAIALLFAESGGLADGVDKAAIAVAEGKLAKSPQEIFCSAILANMLVCLAVWMSMAAQTIPAKVIAIIGPVTLFVAAGLEHSIANMSLLPLGWLAAASATPDLAVGMTNLLFSTLGNVLGGSLLALTIAYGHDSLRAETN